MAGIIWAGCWSVLLAELVWACGLSELCLASGWAEICWWLGYAFFLTGLVVVHGSLPGWAEQ
jgi:hypothetical protein